ncbi:MAG: hypothetical protein JXD19_09820, partial [Deltaproteobacteria bacterium]|nr:hypothetical protein [Deltaproteobacteria bacterium]
MTKTIYSKAVVFLIIIAGFGSLILFLCSPAAARSGGPDSGGYVFYDIAYDWVEITSSGTNTNTVGDDTYATIPIGFDFEFYGTVHDTVYASSNGYLTFGSDRTEWENSPIPNADPWRPNDLIAVFWNDLDMSAFPGGYGEIWYETRGSAPNRMLVVEYVQVCSYYDDPEDGGGPTTPWSSYTFEVILFEGTNAIRFQYKEMRNGNAGFYADGRSATVGIENP